eukprot:6199559-Pleurochrysis_carterae.AAC.2
MCSGGSTWKCEAPFVKASIRMHDAPLLNDESRLLLSSALLLHLHALAVLSHGCAWRRERSDDGSSPSTARSMSAGHC